MNRAQRQQYNRSYRAQNAARCAANDRRKHTAVRQLVVEHYSVGTNRCARCGESRLQCLDVDHIDGGGRNHRKQVGRGYGFYCWLRRNGLPIGYRVLCANCNRKSALEAQRKSLSQSPSAIRARRHLVKVKAEIVTALGGECRRCGEEDCDILDIHHSDGDGKRHRSEVSKDTAGWAFYKAALRSSLDGLQCLCCNCHRLI